MNIEQTYASTPIALLALVAGLILLTAGGELLVGSSTKLARRLGMTPLLIGLTVVAFGTSMPEFFVGLFALLQDHADIMIGNVVGSNIANVGLILGIAGLCTSLPIDYEKVSKELYLLLAVSLLLCLIAWYGMFTRVMGFFFVTIIVLYTYLAYRTAARQKRKAGSKNGTQQEESVGNSLLSIILWLCGGLFLLGIGSDFFIRGAVDVACLLGVNELVIGLTLAALGTSLPELAASFAALRQQQGDLLVGNILGSNLFNLSMVLGCGALVRPFPLSSSLLMRDLPVMFAFSAILIPIFLIKHRLTRLHGGLFLLAYAGYIWLLTE
jgi:cation:H+ antiporter